ncbi:hypothetical protein Tco_1580642, partial [Tanacetum coccineum]
MITNHPQETTVKIPNQNILFDFFYPEESDDSDEPEQKDDDLKTTYGEEQLINKQNTAHVPLYVIPPVFGEEN